MNVFIDVVIGLVTIFFLASMLASSVLEIIARMFAVRGKMMHEGLSRLVPDRWVYLRLINHPMVSSLFRVRPGEGNPPSYLPARNFSIALIDTLFSHQEVSQQKSKAESPKLAKNGEFEQSNKDLKGLNQAIAKAKDDDLSIGHALKIVIDAAPDMETAAKEIENWYDSGMQRVSGWYKGYAQKRLFWIGLVTAILFNIDTLQITDYLTQSSTLRDSVVARAETVVEHGNAALPSESAVDPYTELAQLYQQGLPVGYACLSVFRESDSQNVSLSQDESSRICACWESMKNAWNENFLLKILGWLITAVAVSFGAPFWFDSMKKLVNLRNAGGKPGATAVAADSNDAD